MTRKVKRKPKDYSQSGFTRSPGSKAYPGAYQTTPDQIDRNREHSSRAYAEKLAKQRAQRA